MPCGTRTIAETWRALKKMKLKSLYIFLLLMLSKFGFGQAPDIMYYNDISVNEITWKSTKADLIRQFGQPDTTYDPKFECGAYSTEQQDIQSVELIHYEAIDFLVVDGNVVFQDIYFNEKNDLQLKTDKLTLDFSTTTEELKEYFPVSYKTWLTDEYGILRLWPCENCDSEIWLHIKDGHIRRIQFWDPC